MRSTVFVTALALIAALAACGSGSGKSTGEGATATSQASRKPPVAEFDADSAYASVAAQLAFGPRIPGTEPHARCHGWIAAEMQRRGADTVIVQKGRWSDGTPITNIFAQLNPRERTRVLLVAHYDTRPHADADPSPANRTKPVPGANDGASGVAVLLEVARALAADSAALAAAPGVDFLFVDAEDGGTDEVEESWCLGSQHWSANMPYEALGQPLPAYGILADMVGGRDAIFHPERISMIAAPEVVRLVWSAARKSGHGDRFPANVGAAVTDDHVPLCRAGIPTIDIIENNAPSTGSFPPYWHTVSDDLSVIDRETLRAVGRTLLQTLADTGAP